MEKKYLIPMVDFVEESRKKNNASPFKDEQKEIDTEELYEIYKQSHLRKQEPKLGLFVPTDKNGKYLEKPLNCKDILKGNLLVADGGVILKQCKEYQEAQERVLFVGWEFEKTKENRTSIILGDFSLVFHNKASYYSNKVFLVNVATNKIIEIKTLEDLTEFKLEIK